MHCGEERTAEYTSNSKHVEGVHQDVVLSLEDKHVVERTGDTKRHTIRERTLTKRIDKEYSRSSGNRSGVCNTDPRTHAKAIREFPFTTHISKDAKEEVENYKLVRTTVVEPLIKRSSFPDGVEVEANCVRAGNNSTRDDVVTVHERSSNWFADAVDVHRRSSNECGNEANCSGKKGWDHKNAKPADIQAIIGRSDPFAEIFPSALGLLT